VLIDHVFPDWVGLYEVSQVGFIFTGKLSPILLSLPTSPHIRPSFLRICASGSTFVIGLVFQGVIQDYKEAEKAPCLLSATIDGLDEAVGLTHRTRAIDKEADTFREHMLETLDLLLLWFETNAAESFYDMQVKLAQMYADLAALEKFNNGGAVMTNRLMAEMGIIRLTAIRMRNIRETAYLPAARALMLVRILLTAHQGERGELLRHAPAAASHMRNWALLQVLLLVNAAVAIHAQYITRGLAYLTVCSTRCVAALACGVVQCCRTRPTPRVQISCIAGLFVFLNILASDLDNPLEPPSKRVACCDSTVTVDFKPLLYSRERLAMRVQLSREKTGNTTPVPTSTAKPAAMKPAPLVLVHHGSFEPAALASAAAAAVEVGSADATAVPAANSALAPVAVGSVAPLSPAAAPSTEAKHMHASQLPGGPTEGGQLGQASTAGGGSPQSALIAASSSGSSPTFSAASSFATPPPGRTMTTGYRGVQGL